MDVDHERMMAARAKHAANAAASMRFPDQRDLRDARLGESLNQTRDVTAFEGRINQDRAQAEIIHEHLARICRAVERLTGPWPVSEPNGEALSQPKAQGDSILDGLTQLHSDRAGAVRRMGAVAAHLENMI